MSGLFRATMLAVMAVALATASAGPAAAQETVSVSLNDVPWEIAIDLTNADAGKVVFSVLNDGLLPHNMVIVDTDLPPDGLPVVDGLVDEGQLDVVASTAILNTGEFESLQVDLSYGNYVLICNNAVNHYTAGMFTAFTVVPPVGGVADLPEVAAAPLDSDAAGGGGGALFLVFAAASLGIAAMGGAVWYARRKRVA
jgi:uncharacterized cupredoxin-like copper-binding protein